MALPALPLTAMALTAMPLAGLSSMATRALLAELSAGWSPAPRIEATGGVDAARRLRAHEPVDLAVLAAGPMRQLEAEGVLHPGSLVAIAVSGIALAVRGDAAVPGLADAAAVRRALLAGGRIGYSTGPSGDHLLHLIKDWGLRDTLGPRLVQAPPGVPVGRLLAEGAVDLALQQHSELMGVPGIVIAGPLPPSIQSRTVFTAGLVRTTARPEEARRFIAFLADPAAADTKRRHGMEPP